MAESTRPAKYRNRGWPRGSGSGKRAVCAALRLVPETRWRYFCAATHHRGREPFAPARERPVSVHGIVTAAESKIDRRHRRATLLRVPVALPGPWTRRKRNSPFSRRARPVNGIIEFLLANPLFLAPFLLIAAMMLFAILKKLFKMVAILAIAGVLYTVLVEYFGVGI